MALSLLTKEVTLRGIAEATIDFIGKLYTSFREEMKNVPIAGNPEDPEAPK